MPDSFHIVSDRSGVRLDVFLSEKLSLTRTKVKEMIDQGHVRVGGSVVKSSLKIKPHMEIEGEIPEEEPLSLAPEAIPLDILYEDEYLLAIDKPAQMPVHPSLGHASGTLVNAVLSYLGYTSHENGEGPSMNVVGAGSVRQGQLGQIVYQGGPGSAVGHLAPPAPQTGPINVRPGIVHRLDKGTTGVILVAKDMRTQELLSALFKERDVKKTYRAIIEGHPKREEWIVRGNIGRHPVERKKMAVLARGGRSAETSFRVLERLAGCSYVEACPKTGRTHQIRVHLAHEGHPVVGDEMYGKKAKAWASRPLLHAYRIEFAHPVTHVSVKVEASVPYDMEEFMQGRGRT